MNKEETISELKAYLKRRLDEQRELRQMLKRNEDDIELLAFRIEELQ